MVAQSPTTSLVPLISAKQYVAGERWSWNIPTVKNQREVHLAAKGDGNMLFQWNSSSPESIYLPFDCNQSDVFPLFRNLLRYVFTYATSE